LFGISATSAGDWGLAAIKPATAAWKQVRISCSSFYEVKS
jgi:hypothetical protein